MMKPQREASSFGTPPWLSDWVGPLPRLDEIELDEQGIGLTTAERDGHAVVAARIDGARSLDAPTLRLRTEALYDRLREALDRAATPYPVRLWNFIPEIHAEMQPGIDRYMVFNAGRHDAMIRWFDDPASFSSKMPTATGIGYAGDDLSLWCLAGPRPGEPVENPRQKPAYRYSEKYGPLPPCFARATRYAHGDRTILFVGGTAAVRGEDSVHQGDLDAQLEETFTNLEALVDSARNDAPRDSRMFESLRAYYLHDSDAETVRRAVERRFPGLERLELMRADVCRRELLVEIEGVTGWPRSGA